MNSSQTEGKSNKKRGLGLGFGVGKAFHLKSNEPNRGLINPIPFTKEFLAEIKKIAQDMAKNKNTTLLSALTEAIKSKLGDVTKHQLDDITKDILALTIPDILVDMNISRLDKMMPSLINDFSDDVKKIFSQYGLSKLNDENGQRFLYSIVSSKYELFSGDNVERLINDKINEINDHLTQKNMSLIKNMNVINHREDHEIMAYILPALLDRMNDNDLRTVSYAIAGQLNAKYLLPVADENYFVPDLIASDDPIAIRNANKRSLQFFANSSNTHVYFRDGDYTLQQAHVHFEKGCDLFLMSSETDTIKISDKNHLYLYKNDKGKIYYKIQDNDENQYLDLDEIAIALKDEKFDQLTENPIQCAKQEICSIVLKETSKRDHTVEKDGEENEYDLDGKKFDGEIHTVFEWNYKTGKRLMAIGFPLEAPLDAQDNEEMAKLIDSINALEAVKQWRVSGKATELILDMKHLELSMSYKALFMKYFDEAKKENSFIFHSWGSLRTDTYGFREAGLRFVIAPKPITISDKQYRELKEIFGEMNKSLVEEDKLDPIDRKAGFRQERVQLSASLTQKVAQVGNQQLFKKTI